MPKKGGAPPKTRFSKPTEGAIVNKFLDLVALEIQAGASSQGLSFAGGNHLNDILHTAGLITNDCWNDVKGILSADNAVAVGAPVLKTLVQGIPDIMKALPRPGTEELAAVEAANTADTLGA